MDKKNINSDRSELDLSDEIIMIKKFPFQAKVMMKKLLKLLRYRNSFQAIKDIDPKL